MIPKLIKSTGEVLKISPKNGKDFKLAELQKYVGGPIEMVYSMTGKAMIVNEQGRVTNLPYNEKATSMYLGQSYLFGDVVVCDLKMVK